MGCGGLREAVSVGAFFAKFVLRGRFETHRIHREFSRVSHRFPAAYHTAMPASVHTSVHRGLRPMTRLLVVLVVLSPLALAVPALINLNEPDSNESYECWADAGASPADAAPVRSARSPGELLSIDQSRPIT